MKVQGPGNVGRAQPIRRKKIDKPCSAAGVSSTPPPYETLTIQPAYLEFPRPK